jgi:hypothetical protein
MKTIQVFDPPMCCSTGLCGTNIDTELIRVSAWLTQLRKRGVTVERQNLSQQPMAFAQHPTIKALMDQKGVEVFPVVLIDGAVHVQGRYPNAAEREARREVEGRERGDAVDARRHAVAGQGRHGRRVRRRQRRGRGQRRGLCSGRPIG